jgi:hypothetical protein
MSDDVLDFSGVDASPGRSLYEFISCLSHSQWYTWCAPPPAAVAFATARQRPRGILVTEFSFSYDANCQAEDDDRLEKFPPAVVAGANRLFRDPQNQAGWLAQFGSTKTAYVFEVL